MWLQVSASQKILSIFLEYFFLCIRQLLSFVLILVQHFHLDQKYFIKQLFGCHGFKIMHTKELEAYVIFVLEGEGSGSTRVRRQQRLARGRVEGQEKGGLGRRRVAGEKRLRFYPFLLC